MRVSMESSRTGRPDGCRRLVLGKNSSGRTPSASLCLILWLVGHFGCLTVDNLTSRTGPAPQSPWIPPPEAQKRTVPSPPNQIPPDLLTSKEKWALATLIDVGLANNMLTRAAWGAARSASAALGIARGQYYPTVGAEIAGQKIRGTVAGGLFTFDFTSLAPSAALNMLLLDFGGRSGSISEASLALEAANWNQNRAIQDVILQIESQYYRYLATRALLAEREAALKEAEANLDAAETRHDAGVSTIGDVLQAKTAVSSARLNFVSTEGLIQTIVGSLADAVGLPPNTSFDIPDQLPATLPLDTVSDTVERYIVVAEAKRPELAAARALALRAETHVGTVRSDELPNLVLAGNISRTYYSNRPRPSDNYSIAVALNIPIFTGFSNAYRVLQAKMDAETARAEVKRAEQAVVLDVWISYYGLKTAAQRIKAAEDLNESAEQSYQVALAGYKAGVASILDLLAAQSAHESARVQRIQARTDWLMSLIQFAHATGTLEAPKTLEAGTLPVEIKKGGDRP